MSKVLIASDFHLHRWNNFGVHSDTLLPKRLYDQSEVLSQISQIVREYKVKVFINGGDLFHSVGLIPVEALNIASNFYDDLEAQGVTFLLDGGNHDLVNRIDPKWFHSSIHIFNQSERIVNTHGIKIRLVDFNEKIDYDKIKDFDIVVIHNTPIGAKVNNYEFEDGVNWKLLSLQNKTVFFGHIHQRAQLSDNCFIIGSPMHLNFGDSGTRGVYLIDTDTYNITFLPLKYPEFRTVTSEAEIVDDYNYYRVVGLDHKITGDNVVNNMVPKVFDERIKSEDFDSILQEWTILNNKPLDYIVPLKPLINNKSNLGSKIFGGKIVRVAIKDFISIGDIKYTFKNGFTLITGNNEDKDSNGSGKTSFVDAIFWCLFGETTKGLTGDDVIRLGQKDCNVIVDIKDSENYYLICRSREKGLSIFKSSIISSNLFETELTSGLKQVDRQTILNDILGFGKNTFLSSCYFSQENVKTLTGFSDTEKTNMITNLLGFETYDDLYELVSDRITNNLDTIEELKSQKQKVDNDIVNNSNKIDLLNNELETLNAWKKEYDNNLKLYNTKIAELKESTVILEDIKIIDYDEQLNSVKESEHNTNKLLEECEKEIDAVETENESFSIEMTEQEHELRFITAQKEDLNREILALENSEFGNRCDKCGSTIEKENIELFINEKHAEINQLTIKFNDIKNTISLLNVNKNRINEQLANLTQNRINYIKFIKELQQKKDQIIEDRMKQESRIQENKFKKSGLDSQINNYLNLIKECENNSFNVTNRADKIIKGQRSIIIESSELKAESSNIEKDFIKLDADNMIFDFWKQAFSSKGIRSLLLDRFCNQFNLLVNDYLSRASNGDMSITVSPTKALKSGEDRNKLSIDIIIDGNVRKYDALSGGEKRRCDVSLCLALNKWLANRHGLKAGVLGLLIFDELFCYLDRQGEENIGGMLQQEGRDKIVLVISHTPELSSYSDGTLNIIKRNGISNLYS